MQKKKLIPIFLTLSLSIIAGGCGNSEKETGTSETETKKVIADERYIQLPAEFKSLVDSGKFREAKSLGRKLCEEGNTGVCHYTGYLIGSPMFGITDYPMAVNILEHGCSKDYAISCWRVSNHYIMGTGTAVDKTKAKASLKKACDLGIKRSL